MVIKHSGLWLDPNLQQNKISGKHYARWEW